jgi:hypothetical protein
VEVGSRRLESSWSEMESSETWVWVRWGGDVWDENPRERFDCGWVKSIAETPNQNPSVYENINL